MMGSFFEYLFGLFFSQPDLVKMFQDEKSPPTLEKVRAAIKLGASVKSRASDTRTVLMLAAARVQDPEIITELIKAGAKPDEKRYGVGGCVDSDSGPNRYSHPTTALMIAADSNPNPKVLNALLDGGADPRISNSDGWTAFSYIRRNENLKGTPVYERLQEAHNKKKPADFTSSYVG